ncbi:hypothetical protein [Alicyclobacillus fodiniaquatilis]|uniref:Uncharacterized protein n=1 Tax=Alicyclobacillus fodiniaquatilis TaxID=1661150 RepID=A0ABW4JFX0_9BACL
MLHTGDLIFVRGQLDSLQNERRLGKLEQSHTWLWRTVSGAIIAEAVGTVIAMISHFH